MIAAIETPVGAIVTNVHLQEMIKAAGAAGETLPSNAYLTLLNTLFNSLQSAITDGSSFRNVYADILSYVSDAPYLALSNDLGFDGRKGNDPYLKAIKQGGGTLKKYIGDGFQTDGVAFINRNYNPSNENITSPTDTGMVIGYSNVFNSAQDHTSGISGIFVKTGNTNYGWGCYRGQNTASTRTGFNIFLVQVDTTESRLYESAVDYTPSTTVQITTKPNDNLYSLRVNGAAGMYLDGRTRESICISYKRSSVNRTTLFNAVKTFLYGCKSLYSPYSDGNYILDIIPDAVLSLAPRKLTKNYSGFGVKLRNGVSNAITDVNYSGEVLNPAQMDTASGNGYQTVFVNGINSQNNAATVAATTALQPRLVLLNNKYVFLFDGTDTLDTNSNLPNPSLYFTQCAVINFAGVGTVMQMSNNSGGGDRRFSMSITTGGFINVRFYDDTQGYYGNLISVSGYTGLKSVVVINNNKIITVYVDGVAVSMTTGTSIPTASPAAIFIGSDRNIATQFNSHIGDLISFNRALTASEVTQYANDVSRYYLSI